MVGLPDSLRRFKTMTDTKDKYRIFHKIPVQIPGVLILFLAALFLLWFNNANSSQSVGAVAVQVRFEGEYRIGHGTWHRIEEGRHIC
jgi:hypothetical protein